MTKVIILGEAQGAEPEKKKIEFVKYINPKALEFIIAETPPCRYENIELIGKDLHGTGFDFMFAYDCDRSVGVLYLGKFNDGVV